MSSKKTKKSKRIEDCKQNYILNPLNNRCIKVDRKNKPDSIAVNVAEYLDYALDVWKEANQYSYNQDKENWKKQPGDPGFNNYLYKKMKKAKLKLKLNCKGKNFAHQDTVKYCLHPSTPIDRLLVIHRTGSGKTRIMINVLNNYFFDRRPKIIIFPTQETVNNFYTQLMSFKNRYSDMIKIEYPDLIKELNNISTYNKALQKLKNHLALLGELGKYKKGLTQMAPLRAYRYSVAGGESIFKGNSPLDPIFKIDFKSRNSYDEYSNKIVLMDEFHNLICPSLELSKYKKKLVSLKEHLQHAKNSVIVGFTATPIVDGLEKGKELLNVIKGYNYKSKNNEGFVSYFNSLPSAIYPTVITKKMFIRLEKNQKDVSLEKIKKSRKSFKPTSNYEAYAKAYFNRPSEQSFKTKSARKAALKMCNYINTGIYYTQVRFLKEYFKKNNHKRKEIAKLWATKMFYVIKDIEKHKKKSLILIHRSTGFKALLEIFKEISKAKLFPNCKFCYTKAYDKHDSKNIIEFSKKNNLKGKKIKIIIADSSQFGEGVSFLGVREMYLFNPSLTYSDYLQLRGRVIRACSSHHALPKSERNVTINICIGEVDKPLKSIDKFLMKKIEGEENKYNDNMSFFENIAIDQKILKKFIKKK